MVTFNDEVIHNWGAYCDAIYRDETPETAQRTIEDLKMYNDSGIDMRTRREDFMESKYLGVISLEVPKSHGLTGVYADMEAELEAEVERRIIALRKQNEEYIARATLEFS